MFLQFLNRFTGIQASRRDSDEALTEGGRGNSASRRNLYVRHALVAFQVAAALILLVGAGLLIRSFVRLMNVDTGFETEGVIAAYLPVPMERNPEISRGTNTRPQTDPRPAVRKVVSIAK